MHETATTRTVDGRKYPRSEVSAESLAEVWSIQVLLVRIGEALGAARFRGKALLAKDCARHPSFGYTQLGSDPARHQGFRQGWQAVPAGNRATGAPA
jgi:hypothetical protein